MRLKLQTLGRFLVQYNIIEKNKMESFNSTPFIEELLEYNKIIKVP
jgi:hypothetical protein